MERFGSAQKGGWNGRLEDDALLRGAGRFGDDVKADGALAVCFVRSPHALARIAGIDASRAKAVPGVAGVFTGADLAAAHYHSVSHPHPIPDRNGKIIEGPFRPALAHERVNYVGEPVALVVAQTLGAAQDAADLVAVDYEPLAAIVGAQSALREGATELWPKEAPGNVAFDWIAPADLEGKNRARLDEIFGKAAHVVRIDLNNQRLACASLEPRTASASYDAAKDMFTLRCGTQGVAGVRMQTAGALNIRPEQLHVLTDDVGGGFGMKASGYPEYVALLHAARALGKPVHWASSRTEAFLGDNNARDSFWTAELALSARGKFLGLRVEGLANVGAYVTGVAHFCSTLHISGCLPTVYDIPVASVRARCIVTNTVPIGPYRGAGRPEASFLLERVIDTAADRLGIDPAELRRRNLIRPEQIPYKTPFGNTYDSGDFPALFEKARALADYDGFRERRKQAKRKGKLRGIGIGCYLEIAGAIPEEGAGISFPGGDKVNVSIGAGASGQGHKTVFGRLAAEQLGIAREAVTVTAGDSARDVPGFGAVASRSAFMVGNAVAHVVRLVIDKGRGVAALLMQAGEADVDYVNGRYTVRNSDRSVSLFEVAEHARELVRQNVVKETLDTRAVAKTPATFPNGCHIAEVEIDPATGALSVPNYVAVGDCGVILDETIVEAQVHGGVAQGLGQALCEGVVYEGGGQLLSASFMDYAMPRSTLVPSMTVEHMAVPCKSNPLGVKGTGEAGTTAATPALINAVIDALPAGANIEMPATAEKIWRALHNSR
ncbi:MAG TPA: xanthine dehydrogenase family protein molybdopterin-binding subunit [Pseudolabrys sp.]|nr:xanthine dehydrogenase family protein molybdopterin-binding subunit [Pseudolabrys sp.]